MKKPHKPRTGLRHSNTYLTAAFAALAFFAGAPAQAQVTGVSIGRSAISYGDGCSSLAIPLSIIGTCSAPSCATTSCSIEISQNGKKGRREGALGQCTDGHFGSLSFEGDFTSVEDLGGGPFTITFTVTDNGKTFSKTRTVADCIYGGYLDTYTVTATAFPAAGGTITCMSDSVADDGMVECTAVANPGYTLEKLEISDGWAAPATCTGSPSCTAELSEVRDDVTATAKFEADGGSSGQGSNESAPPPASGSTSSSPTMGEAGLLLSALAVAGAAAPALRRRERRERKERKQD